MRVRPVFVGLLALGVLLGPRAAHALPAVQFGSPYSFYIAGETSGNAQTLLATFDGVAESFSRGGLDLLLNESDVALAGTSRLITIDLRANGDLFPSAGEGAISGLGTFSPGLDLTRLFHLDDARIKLFTPAGLLFTTGNLADDYRTQYFSDPWTGLFPRAGGAFNIGNSGGRGIDGVTFEFTVSDVPVPEPGTLALLGLGLSALGLRRRRAR